MTICRLVCTLAADAEALCFVLSDFMVMRCAFELGKVQSDMLLLLACNQCGTPRARRGCSDQRMQLEISITHYRLMLTNQTCKHATQVIVKYSVITASSSLCTPRQQDYDAIKAEVWPV